MPSTARCKNVPWESWQGWGASGTAQVHHTLKKRYDHILVSGKIRHTEFAAAGNGLIHKDPRKSLQQTLQCLNPQPCITPHRLIEEICKPFVSIVVCPGSSKSELLNAASRNIVSAIWKLGSGNVQPARSPYSHTSPRKAID